jgi:hypothetical protein
MLSARGDIHYLEVAALVIFVFLVQLLQQFVHLLQNIGGQHVAETSQKVWDFFIVIHISNFFLSIKQMEVDKKGRGLVY